MCFIFVSADIIRNLECVLYLCQQLSFGILNVFYICVSRYHSESWMCFIFVSEDIIRNLECVLYVCQ